MTADSLDFLERFYGRSVRCRHCGGPGTRNGNLAAFGLCWKCWKNKEIRAPYAAEAKAKRRAPTKVHGRCYTCRQPIKGKCGAKCLDCVTAEIRKLPPSARVPYAPTAPRYCIHGLEDGLCAPCERCERSTVVFAEQPCSDE